MVSAEPFGDAQPPARIPELPAELALGLGVRGTPHLGHHERCHLTGCQPPQPPRDTPWWLGTQRARQDRQPLPHRRGLVIDDVVDTRLAALDRDGGRRRGVLDVDMRPDATTVTDDREPTLAYQPRHLRVRSQADPGPRTVEAAVAQRQTLAPVDRGHRLLQIEERLHYRRPRPPPQPRPRDRERRRQPAPPPAPVAHPASTRSWSCPQPGGQRRPAGGPTVRPVHPKPRQRKPSWQLLTRVGHLQRRDGASPCDTPPGRRQQRSRSSRSTNARAPRSALAEPENQGCDDKRGTYRFGNLSPAVAPPREFQDSDGGGPLHPARSPNRAPLA